MLTKSSKIIFPLFQQWNWEWRVFSKKSKGLPPSSFANLTLSKILLRFPSKSIAHCDKEHVAMVTFRGIFILFKSKIKIIIIYIIIWINVFKRCIHVISNCISKLFVSFSLGNKFDQICKKEFGSSRYKISSKHK